MCKVRYVLASYTYIIVCTHNRLNYECISCSIVSVTENVLR